MSSRINRVERKNPQTPNCVGRQTFQCIEIDISIKSKFLEKAYALAREIEGDLNPGQANTSEVRGKKIVAIDNLSGVIAELACEEIFRWYYGEGKIIKPESSGSKDQIDLRLYNDKTIEVRSSCVRNGMDFALFFKNKKKPDEQYFDVIGPYSNNYKHGEIFKDYYMRVLYVCNKTDFMDLFDAEYLRLYITGGATKQMMQDPELYQIKHLEPSGGQVKVESDYRVIPLAKSLDVRELQSKLERENDQLICRRK